MTQTARTNGSIVALAATSGWKMGEHTMMNEVEHFDSGRPTAGLRVAGRLSSGVVTAIDRRLALLDELDTLEEQRSELTRAAQALGGPQSSTSTATPEAAPHPDPRRGLSSALDSIEAIEREFEALKRAANEGRR